MTFELSDFKLKGTKMTTAGWYGDANSRQWE